MAITYVGKGTESLGGTSHTVSLPAGVEAGDLLLLQVTGHTPTVCSTPSGWTMRARYAYDSSNDNMVSYFWKIAVGEEGSASVTTPASDTRCIIFAFRGVDPVDPWDIDSPEFGLQTSNSPTVGVAAITTETDGAFAILNHSYDNNAGSVSTDDQGYTDADANHTSYGNDWGWSFHYKEIASAGAISGVTVTTSGGNQRHILYHDALKPYVESAGGSTPGPVRAVEQARVVPSHEAFTMGLRHGPGT